MFTLSESLGLLLVPAAHGQAVNQKAGENNVGSGESAAAPANIGSSEHSLIKANAHPAVTPIPSTS